MAWPISEGILTYPRLLVETVGESCTDVEAPIQTVIQTVGKHGTDVQTVNILRVSNFITLNSNRSLRLYRIYQRSV
jgi:hypothetical protein